MSTCLCRCMHKYHLLHTYIFAHIITFVKHNDYCSEKISNMYDTKNKISNEHLQISNTHGYYEKSDATYNYRIREKLH